MKIKKRKKAVGGILANDKVTFDPDKLNLTKKDLVDFCDKCMDEWKQNKRDNFRYLIAMSIMKAQISVTPEKVLKMIWGKIINWFYDLNFENALHDPTDTAMEFFNKIRNVEDP